MGAQRCALGELSCRLGGVVHSSLVGLPWQGHGSEGLMLSSLGVCLSLGELPQDRVLIPVHSCQRYFPIPSFWGDQ